MANTGIPSRRLVLGKEALRIGAVFACGLATWSVVGGTALAAPPYTRVADGFDFEENIRPAIANDGTVVAARATAIQVGDGVSTSTFDLAPSNRYFTPGSLGAKAVQVRTEGDVLFVADRSGVIGCSPPLARGVYRTDTLGAPITTVFEECIVSGPSSASTTTASSRSHSTTTSR